MQTLTAARNAMATRFEMVLHGPDPIRLRAAADAAFQEIERLHAQLSLYSASSEVTFINAHASERAVRVEPGLFSLLQLAKRIHQETGGAFDITIGPLMRCWGFMNGSGSLPSPEQIAASRDKVGMEHVHLDEERSTVRFQRDGMMIDLGSIGKGYALDIATESLREAGIESALLHGGTSTVCALGHPPGAAAWTVAIEAPPLHPPEQPPPPVASPPAPNRPLALVPLCDNALSVSGVHGKCFRDGNVVYGHVIDPRTGSPGRAALLAAAILPLAVETDALSTALLLGGLAEHEALAGLRADLRTLVVERAETHGRWRCAGKGVSPLPSA